jgi:hypothetical protein
VAASNPAMIIAASHSGNEIGSSNTKALLRDLFHDRGDVKRLNKRRAVNILMIPSFRKAIDPVFTARFIRLWTRPAGNNRSLFPSIARMNIGPIRDNLIVKLQRSNPVSHSLGIQ